MKARRVLSALLKTVLPLVVGLAALAVVIAWLSGLFVEKIPPGETSAVRRVLRPDQADRIDEVHEVVKPYYHEAVGTLKAATRTEIAARIMAPIREITVKAGDRVEKGDLLVSLDSRDIESRMKQAQAELDGARAALGQAESDFKRDAGLFAKAVIPRVRFEQSKTAVDVAQAKVAQAEEAVAEAKIALSYTTIQAAQAGTIVDRMAEPGDIARPGVPLLVLYDPASLRLEVPVMENLAVQLRLGESLSVHIDALDRDVEAVVDEIVPQAEAASRSFLVKVALPRMEGVYEGMFGRLRIPGGTRRHLCLATAAIQTVGQNQFVDALAPDGKTLRRRFITTGKLGMPGRIEVLSGLQAGDRVLLRPAGAP